MFNKGDKVSVLDEAVDGVVLSVKDKVVTIDSGWFCDEFCSQ